MYRVKAILMLTALVASSAAQASYDANISGVVVDVLTYETGGLLFRLANQPTSHPGCDATFFAISYPSDSAAVNRMYARLLVSHALQEPINIGYDSTGDCVQGYIHTWRVG